MRITWQPVDSSSRPKTWIGTISPSTPRKIVYTLEERDGVILHMTDRRGVHTSFHASWPPHHTIRVINSTELPILPDVTPRPTAPAAPPPKKAKDKNITVKQRPAPTAVPRPTKNTSSVQRTKRKPNAARTATSGPAPGPAPGQAQTNRSSNAEVNTAQQTTEQPDNTDDIFAVFQDAPQAPRELSISQQTDDTASSDDDDEPTDVVERLEQLAAPTIDAAPLGFQAGHGLAPSVTLMTGANLLTALQLPPATMPTLTIAAMVKDTRDCHKRLLRMLCTMSTPFKAMQISVAIVAFLTEQAKQRHWRKTTLLKYLCATQGALGALPIYRHGALPISLGQCPVWRNSIRSAARDARAEIPTHPHRALRQHIIDAIARTQSLPVRAVIALAWAVAGRVGDITRLLLRDTQLIDRQLTITYRHHKTMVTKGPYSITTTLEAEDARVLRKWLEQRRQGAEHNQQWLFPHPKKLGTEVRKALKEIDPKLEQRSIRRGSLLQMAERGVPEATLLEFSGHSTTHMLRRYLQWGAALQSRNNSTTAAGQLLA